MFESFNSILKTIDSFVWGLPLIILIISVGLFLTIRLKGLQITKLGLAIKHTVKNARAAARASGERGALARAGAPLPLRRRGKRPAYFFCAGRWRAVLSGLRRLQRL